MKKGTKIALWMAAGCIFIGGVLMGVGSAMGGQEQLEQINENSMGVNFQGFGLSVGGLNDLVDEGTVYKGEEKTPGEEVLNGDFSRSFSVEGLKKLEIVVGVHTLTLVEAEVNEVTLEGRDCEKIQCYVRDGELILKDVGRKDASLHSDGRRLTLTVPKGFSWKEADVDAAMASVTMDRLEAADMDLTAGMGNIEIKELSASELDIEADMGAVTVEEFSASDLDISADMGSVEMEGVVGRSLDAEANMGSIMLKLAQDKADFNYNIETSMGSVKLDGENYTRLDQEMFINNMAQGSMELDASMGSIEISFE